MRIALRTILLFALCGLMPCLAVYLPDGSRIKYEEKSAALLQNESELSTAISAVRAKIEAKGIVLDKWSLPTTEQN